MRSIDVKQFIYDNYTEYTGNGDFLKPLSKRNEILWKKCQQLLKDEKEAGGILDIETKIFSGITNFAPGYIDKENELIVGLQTDAPLKRIINPYGGWRMVEKSLKAYDKEIDEELKKNFREFRKTHNDGVFDVYTPEIKAARHAGLITGLPDAYGRGRIIGDYRRVALYGVDKLIEEKKKDLEKFNPLEMDNWVIQIREEIAMQIKALQQMKEMAQMYGCNIAEPATTAREAIQAIYFAYLAGAKENNGAATSLGRVSTFIDIYIENDIKKGLLDEVGAQELIDQFVMKLRFIRHLRTPEYDELFAGDPTWVTEAIGGMGPDGKSLVTKTSFRFLRTLINLGPAPEPNLTILWDEELPSAFKKYCAEISILTNSIQYENDNLMKSVYGEDYGIACCVSGMRLGKQTQFFGARCNVAKALLYAINEGKDENTGEIIIKNIPRLSSGILNYNEVWSNYKLVIKELARIYVQANNIIHYMHDKYAYEASQMALHDSEKQYLMAFGAAGLSVAADSLSAIKFAEVMPIRNENHVAIDFKIKGDFPKFGNDENDVDLLAVDIVCELSDELNKHHLYKHAQATLSILTITSNVVYGKKTGATPDGRPAKAPFAPGANPMHGRDVVGPSASLNSVSKIPYKNVCEDGISNTFSIVPSTLGTNKTTQINNLVAILDSYFYSQGHHLNVNVMDRQTLIDAMENPNKYPFLTIRISGYAVLFNSLTNEQKVEIINRTYHE